MNERKPNRMNAPRVVYSVLLAFLLAWGLVPVPALAEVAIELEGNASAEYESIEELVEAQDDGLGLSNDELFESYIQKQFDQQLPESADDIDVTTQSAGDYLEGNDVMAYEAVRDAVQQIAAGARSSTVIEIPLADLIGKVSWTFTELGVTNPWSNGSLTSEAKAAINAKAAEASIDFPNVCQAVRADCPYEMYWYGRSISYSAGLGYSVSGDTFTLKPNPKLSLAVAPNYAAGEYMVDTTLAQSVQTAVARATSIANDHKNEPTSAMLTSYKQAICNLASYNEAARDAASIADFGTNNPWELVWVFDGDEETSVVCEGYSKAFKYLCDLSGRTDVECLTVTGDMGNVLDLNQMGGHMWNVVRMPDSKNYLVDVTNCDEGSAGNPDYLFLKGYSEGGYANNYYGFTTRSKTGKNYFVYDGEAKSTYPQADLELSSADYNPVHDVTPGKQSISPVVTIQGWTYGQSANAPQLTEGSNPGNGAVTYEYKVAGAGDNTYTTAVPTSAGSYTVRATVAETDAYLSGTAMADFTISKATPDLGTVTANTVVDDLDASEVVLDRTNTSVAGTLSLVETTLQYGTNTYHWTFAPSDMANYNACEGTVSITVSGHDWGAAEYVWSENMSSVTATRVCKNNPAHVETETANTGSEVTTPATCTVSGVRTYTATFSNVAFETQTKQVTIPATGHTWGGWYETKPPTATQKGEETRECSKCHATETRDIDPSGQTDISGATVGLSVSSFTYDGTAHEPGVIVDVNGMVLDADDFTVSYQRDGVATSDLKNAGTVTVVVTGVGDYTGTASTSFTIAPRQLGIVWTSTTFTYNGKVQTPSATITNVVKGEEVSAWITNSESNAGTYTINMFMVYSGGYTQASNYVSPSGSPKQFTILPLSIDSDAITVDEIPALMANGNELTPEPAISFNGAGLEKDTDFELAYSSNVDPGTATVTITGKGNFTGTRTVTFQIMEAEPQLIDISEAEIYLEFPNEPYRYTETGIFIEPQVDVFLGDVRLRKDEDYTLEKKNNRYPGIATVIVTGCGKFTGIASTTYTILKGIQEIYYTLFNTDLTYGVEPFELNAWQWEGDGMLSYESSDSEVVNVSSSGLVTVEGVGEATITIIASESQYFEETKMTVDVTVSPLSIDSDAITVDEIPAQTASGNELTPEPAISFNGAGLEKGTDFELAYSSNVDPGTATVTITGKGNFTGTRTVTFQIVEAEPQLIDISGATIELEKTSYVYKGYSFRPSVTVWLNGVELKRFFDYDVSYQDNVNAGTATVVVTGCGDYTGTASTTFTITKADQEISHFWDSIETELDSPIEYDLGVQVVKGDGVISYKSSNTNVVTVSKTGVLAFTGVGTATITISAAATKNYNKATASVLVSVSKAANPIKASAKKATVTTTYNPTADVVTGCNVTVSKAQGAVTYKNASADATAKTFKVSKTTGKVTVPKATPAGTYAVKVKATAAGNDNYKSGSKTVAYSIVVKKAANPMKVKVENKAASFSTLKKKAVVVACPATVSKAQGKVTYAKAGGSEALTINKTTGKVTVKKGTKKGTYSIKIKVTAAGNGNYNKGTETVTAKVVVK